jgi:hypothetical protein
MSYQIDNMEGLDVVSRPDGDMRVILVSDDNHSILERNLMLEFRLKDDANRTGADRNNADSSSSALN